MKNWEFLSSGLLEIVFAENTCKMGGINLSFLIVSFLSNYLQLIFYDLYIKLIYKRGVKIKYTLLLALLYSLITTSVVNIAKSLPSYFMIFNAGISLVLLIMYVYYILRNWLKSFFAGFFLMVLSAIGSALSVLTIHLFMGKKIDFLNFNVHIIGTLLNYIYFTGIYFIVRSFNFKGNSYPSDVRNKIIFKNIINLFLMLIAIALNFQYVYLAYSISTFSFNNAIFLCINIIILGYVVYYSVILNKNLISNYRLSEQLKEKNSKLEISNNELQFALAELKDAQDRLVESEKLSSVGQLMGGIAHNLQSPLMASSGGIMVLKKNSDKLNKLLEEKNISDDEVKKIFDNMSKWEDRIDEYLRYISDVIKTVKGQVVGNDNATSIFYLKDLVDRVFLLMEYEIIKGFCKISKKFAINISNIPLKGDVTVLVQIINNIIINAIHSYDGKGGEIEFTIYKEEDNIIISIKDYGKGISNDIKPKLLNQMITTKGKNGTGLGLYISNTRMKAIFNGKIEFESEEGSGTTFYLYIPGRVIDEHQSDCN